MKILLTILLFPLLALGQTAQLSFTYKTGTIIGRWQVTDLPTSLFTYGTPQGQMLTFYPPAYKQGKICGLMVFNPGDGENTTLDITQVTYNSLPRMIQAGMTPYSILPNKDTLFWVVAVLHNSAGSAYRTQQAQIMPWILDKSGIRYDPKHVCVTGLSGGGSATWATVMIDTTLSKRITVIIPMANGGYDNQLSILMSNLVAACKNDVYFFPFIGTQDPGFNATGFWAYDAVLKNWCLPDHYHPHIIPNGGHNATTWDVPWNTRAVMDSIGSIGWTQPAVTPSGPPVKAKILQDSLVINYPNTAAYFFDSSYSLSGKLLNTSFAVDVYTGTVPPILTRTGSGGLWLSRLMPGAYQIKLYAFDSATNYVDTAYAYVKVNGPAPCPICPVCPAPRNVSTLQVNLFGIWLPVPLDAAKIGYDDGSSQ